MLQSWDTIVIGGGFFGSALARELAHAGKRTLLLEAGDTLLERASLRNQARVHGGYHYPRSYLTGLRSRINAPRFIADYRDCIHDAFTHYYAIGRAYSNVTAEQFRRFCERIGAPVASAPSPVTKLFSSHLIEDVVQVSEVAFDAVRLRHRLLAELERARVDVRLGARAALVQRRDDGLVEVLFAEGRDDVRVAARQVFNCTYSRLNVLNAASGLPIVPLKHELAEMVLLEPPAELAETGITVMCGPFFSLVPYPSLGLHTLSHVRYTPHLAWHDASGGTIADPDGRLSAYHRGSAFPAMIRDAARYLPVIAGARRVDSLWEIKTVLPRSEVDDSRPILLARDHGIPGYHCVLGSKVDNVYDVLQQVSDWTALAEAAS